MKHPRMLKFASNIVHILGKKVRLPVPQSFVGKL